MARYIFSLVCGGLLAAFTLVLTGGSFLTYYDFPSLLITVIFPFVLMYIVQGNKTTKAAFGAPFKKNNSKETLILAHDYFTNYTRVTWLSGVIAVITGAIGILRHLDTVSVLGPFMALILISLLYAAWVTVFVLLPFKMLIQQKLRGGAEAPAPGTEAGVEMNRAGSAAKAGIKWALRIVIALGLVLLIIVVSVTATIVYHRLHTGDLP